MDNRSRKMFEDFNVKKSSGSPSSSIVIPSIDPGMERNGPDVQEWILRQTSLANWQNSEEFQFPDTRSGRGWDTPGAPCDQSLRSASAPIPKTPVVFELIWIEAASFNHPGPNSDTSQESLAEVTPPLGSLAR